MTNIHTQCVNNKILYLIVEITFFQKLLNKVSVKLCKMFLHCL